MKTDLHCSTLHQVCPHCAPVRACCHYSSLSQWVWRWKKRWKIPSLFYPQPKKQKSISSIGPCLMTGCLAFYWCSSHTYTHKQKPIWHLFSSLLLAVHCPCHMASEKAPECVQASNVCVWMCRLWGQRGVTGGWPTDKDSPLHQWSLWIHGDKPGWMGEQKPWRSLLRREGGGVWITGALARWM